MKILVIEDTDFKYQQILEYLIMNNETNITRATSRNAGLGEMKIADMNNDPFELVICDNFMPIYEDSHDISPQGLHIVKCIRHKYENVFICMSSSDEMEEGDYDYSIKFSPSLDLSADFKDMLYLARQY